MTKRRPLKLIWSISLLAVFGICMHCSCPNPCHAQSQTNRSSTDDITLRATVNGEFGAPEFEQGRIKSINGRIKLLKSILEEGKNRQLDEASSPPIIPVEPPADTVKDQTAPVIEAPTIPDSPQPPEVEDVAKQALVESDIATAAINSFELGYSLFMTGNFKAASRNFKALIKEDLPPNELAWLQCFIGCCDRLQQDFDRAEERFRSTVDQKRAPDLATSCADWNLQYIAQRKQSVEEMKQVSQQLEQILKEIGNAQ